MRLERVLESRRGCLALERGRRPPAEQQKRSRRCAGLPVVAGQSRWKIVKNPAVLHRRLLQFDPRGSSETQHATDLPIRFCCHVMQWAAILFSLDLFFWVEVDETGSPESSLPNRISAARGDEAGVPARSRMTTIAGCPADIDTVDIESLTHTSNAPSVSC